MTPAGNWIHSFTVTDSKLHKKGYTIYKITSIIFPRSIPQALTCITIWKRFHEIKKLHRELSRRHKNLHLSGQLPEPTDSSFFKRFDEDVIRRRKIYIQQLLEFAAEHPALYKCHAFTQFFNDGVKHSVLTPEPSPEHHLHIKFRAVNENGGISVGNNVHEVDAFFNICDKLITSQNNDNNEGDKNLPFNLLEIDKQNDETALEMTMENVVEPEKPCKDFTRFLTPMASIESDDSDYIYDAALEFSNAVQAEANLEYKEAYTKYKSGVEILLNGSKDDSNEDRKFIAKAKISKYLARSDEIYDKFLSICDSPKNVFQLSIDVGDHPSEFPNLYLERPWNHLTKYKVLQILGDRVMQVQSITEQLRPLYIMKGIEKPPSISSTQTIFLPQHVPFMVNLVAFFQSKHKLFLLLRQAENGRLYDYIKNYIPPVVEQQDIEAIEIHEDTQDVESLSNNSAQDSGFIDTNCGQLNLSDETDLDDIVKSSIQLLDSVSNTLKNVRQLEITPRITLNEEEGVEAKEEIEKDAKEPKEEEITTSDLSPQAVGDNNNCNEELEAKITYGLKFTKVPEACLKKWSCQLAIAIHSLHCKGVILGDLHMENLLLDAKGQLLLTYFYQHESHQEEHENSIRRSYNFNAFGGHFVAPERVLTCKSDWWSYGVILYQLFVGLPFKTIHPGAIFLYGSIQFPDNIDITDNLRDLLESLLEQTPEVRLDYEQIQAHAYFKDINWMEIRRCGVDDKNLISQT